MAFQNSKSKNRAVKSAAKGDAPNTGAPGPTPAPTRTYKNPVLTERQEPTGYGIKDLGPSSTDPGLSRTSPLADELKRVAAEGDGGDVLADIIQRGTARDVTSDLGGSPQTRPVSDEGCAPSYGMKLPNMKAGSYGTLPAKLGAPAVNPARKP